jgi:hypothetical protein
MRLKRGDQSVMTVAVGHNETKLDGDEQSVMQTEPAEQEDEAFDLEKAMLEHSPPK